MSRLLLICSIFLIAFGANFFIITTFPVSVWRGYIVLFHISLLLIFFVKFYFAKSRPFLSPALNSSLTLVTTMFVQLIIISTGGLYSPFLILFHLLALGLSFLINFWASLIFLVTSVGIVSYNTFYIDPQARDNFNNDPLSGILYLSSFALIIPLARLLTRYYFLKDTILKVLNRQVKLSESKQDSLLKSVNELVFVTDVNLKIVSANESTEKTFGMTSAEMVNKLLFDVIQLKDESGNPASLESLSIDKVLEDKSTRILQGFYFDSPVETRNYKVSIQLRPVVDTEGKISQLVFVITDGRSSSFEQSHSFISGFKLHQKMLVESLKNPALSPQAKKLHLNSLVKTEEDLLTLLEIEDRSISEHLTYIDLAVLGKKVVLSRLSFAEDFNVKLEYRLPEGDESESSLTELTGSSAPGNVQTGSGYGLSIDQKWAQILIEKLIELGILSASQGLIVKVSFRREGGMVFMTLGIPNQIFSSLDNQKTLFEQYYGDLTQKTNLYLGSGLEGYIVKRIATELRIKMDFVYLAEISQFNIKVQFNRDPRVVLNGN
jgi:PAS domain-containing protein